MSKPSSRSKKSPAPPPSSKRPAKTFPYRAIVPGGGRADLRPGFPIVVHGPNGHMPMYGLIDSGADDALFPLVIAARLGIDLAKCRRDSCETAGGTADQYIWEPGVEIEIQAMGGMRIPAKASFSAGLPSRIVLLGRSDFFSAFRVYLDERAKLFRLEPY